jgi:hypothetical protein
MVPGMGLPDSPLAHFPRFARRGELLVPVSLAEIGTGDGTRTHTSFWLSGF